jgi:glycosyltransferase involved in cell wall biosynthesis
MRLLLLTPEFDGHGGGIITFYRALAPALRANGVELRIIEGSAVHAAADRNTRLQEDICIETLELARLERWQKGFAAFAATPGLRRHLAAAWAMWEQGDYGEGCDVVEACDWGLLFVPPAVQAVRPLVVQCHGSIGQIAVHDPIAGEETQNLLTRLIERAALAVVGSVQSYSRANADFWRTETGRDVAMIRPAWRQLGGGEPAIQKPVGRGLVVGRVQRWKGPEVLCAALQRLGAHAPGIDWVGRDTAWGARESSSAMHLSHTFPSVWGYGIRHYLSEPSQKIARRQASALFNLVPSSWDVFNFTAVEAMASGRPTIISTGAGASELIGDQTNGYLFAAGDPDSLADALDRILGESPARLAAIGQAARETVRTMLDPNVIAVQRIAAYRAAIDAFALQPPPPGAGWIGDICRPTEPLLGSEMAFLDHHPLRAIATHVIARGRRKVVEHISRKVGSR